MSGQHDEMAAAVLVEQSMQEKFDTTASSRG